MKILLTSLIVVLLFVSCGKKEETEKEITLETEDKKDFEMYEFSEMALLMEQMYVDNERLKEKIINGEDLGDFPSHFVKIHTADMTDSSDNDDFYQKHAEIFLKAQQMIYKEPENAKQHYNNAVNTCIQCHEVKCTGPIVRIKKLNIQQ